MNEKIGQHASVCCRLSARATAYSAAHDLEEFDVRVPDTAHLLEILLKVVEQFDLDHRDEVDIPAQSETHAVDWMALRAIKMTLTAWAGTTYKDDPEKYSTYR